MTGDEDYQLYDLHPQFARATGRLPSITLGVHCICEDEDQDEWNVLKLDGVHFDWRNDDRVMLT
ncbi:DUF2169 domain-containing protein, partial [Rhizobium leguminosarum]|uniref:DUF2169 domain-containing protein n=1 Tax=Rhizobium leguminosarum TaxID=384 RepID=UPI003F98CF22